MPISTRRAPSASRARSTSDRNSQSTLNWGGKRQRFPPLFYAPAKGNGPDAGAWGRCGSWQAGCRPRAGAFQRRCVDDLARPAVIDPRPCRTGSGRATLPGPEGVGAGDREGGCRPAQVALAGTGGHRHGCGPLAGGEGGRRLRPCDSGADAVDDHGRFGGAGEGKRQAGDGSQRGRADRTDGRQVGRSPG